jgi:hypothetical protein
MKKNSGRRMQNVSRVCSLFELTAERAESSTTVAMPVTLAPSRSRRKSRASLAPVVRELEVEALVRHAGCDPLDAGPDSTPASRFAAPFSFFPRTTAPSRRLQHHTIAQLESREQ